MKRLLLLLPLLFLFVNSANAQDIWSSNSTGVQKTFFYTNESVYVTGNISTTTMTADIYIMNDSNSWANNTNLTNYVSATRSASTNSSGYLQPTLAWISPITGSYDIVLDLDQNGNYTSNIDYVYNLSSAGFSVIPAPFPALTFSVGAKSPSNHKWNASDVGDNLMLQLKIKADNENMEINSFSLIAAGSGNDKTGISLIRLVTDDNNNGVFESNETMIGYGKFGNDDSVLEIPIQNGYAINAGATTYFLFLYTMGSSVSDGDTFSFQILSSSATGITSGKTAKLFGLPLSSAVKTITNNQTNQTIICSNYTNNTVCSNAGCSWCNYTSSCKNLNESCISNCSGSVELSLEMHGNKSTARISGLSDCNKSVYLKQDGCGGTIAGNCDFSGTDCWISFPTPASNGDYTYFACVDKDGDGNYTSGESKSSILLVRYSEEVAKSLFDWDTAILIIAIVALVIGSASIIFWLKRSRKSKPYTYEFKT